MHLFTASCSVGPKCPLRVSSSVKSLTWVDISVFQKEEVCHQHHVFLGIVQIQVGHKSHSFVCPEGSASFLSYFVVTKNCKYIHLDFDQFEKVPQTPLHILQFCLLYLHGQHRRGFAMFGDIDIIWTWQKSSANINQQLPALKTEANSAMRNVCLQYFSSAAFYFLDALASLRPILFSE